MKLSIKMALIFTVVMLVSLFILSYNAGQLSVDGANAFTQSRFQNMSATIQRDLEQDISMMQLTLRELSENTSFVAAINQMVRDDSADQKMAIASSKAAMQQLLQSPLVDTFYRVTFFTRDGVFLTTYADRDHTLTTGSVEARVKISELAWLDKADSTSEPVILSPHSDVFSTDTDVQVYGIIQQFTYHGNQLGYIEIDNEYSALQRIMAYVDDSVVSVEAVFNDGLRLFQSQEVTWEWPDDLVEGTFTTVTMADGSKRSVLHTYISSLGLHLYISQDYFFIEASNTAQREEMFRTALIIMVPAAALIILISIGLTYSIRKLTKKVRQLPADSVLHANELPNEALLTTVTSPGDKEIYDLEQVLNHLMIKLRDSTTNEMALREGALHAQLSALQTQINPHFIYNTLNIISAKSMESGNYDVIEICDQFAQMLRYSTDTRSRTATMAEEIENVRNYLMLAKARYENNLEFTIEVPENLSEITVPKLTLQPLVENALTHGFNGQNELRRLSVTGRIEKDQLILCIRDNGTGFSEEMLQSLRARIREIEKGKVSIEASGGHIGLANTCLRLYYYSHGQMHVSIHNENGAVITITMPCAAK
jgi:two-component system, sensor histidine kinase YesM